MNVAPSHVHFLDPAFCYGSPLNNPTLENQVIYRNNKQIKTKTVQSYQKELRKQVKIYVMQPPPVTGATCNTWIPKSKESLKSWISLLLFLFCTYSFYCLLPFAYLILWPFSIPYLTQMLIEFSGSKNSDHGGRRRRRRSNIPYSLSSRYTHLGFSDSLLYHDISLPFHRTLDSSLMECKYIYRLELFLSSLMNWICWLKWWLIGAVAEEASENRVGWCSGEA